MSRVALDPNVTATWPPDAGTAGELIDGSVTVLDAVSGPRATPPVALADSGLERPKIADRYVALRPLGQGGAGAVYAAYDSELHRNVALKFIRRRLVSGDAEEWRARMMREAMAMARLSHPNVVTLYDVGVSSEDGVFLAMELVEGGTLADWLRSQTRSWRQIVSMLCDAGEGLAAAHRAGMIHRDFKLDNVLLGSDGRPRVTDFGLARTAEERVEEAPLESASPGLTPSRASAATPPRTLDSLPDPAALAKLTLTGSIMGTPGYMAPEQYTNNVELDARADVFAFCATLYRALYGERPFKGEGLKHIALSTIEGEVSRPPKGSGVPSWLRKVVVSGLASDRDARPASMEELLAMLRAGPAKQRWRRFATVAAAGVCAIALGVPVALAHRAAARAVVDGPARTETTADSPESAGVAREADRQDTVASVASEATYGEPPSLGSSVVAVGASPSAVATAALAPKPATRGAGARAKGSAVVANQAAGHPSRAASPTTPRCTVETSYDAEGAPHFKKICD